MNENSSAITTLKDGAVVKTCHSKDYHRILLVLKEAFPDVPNNFFESIVINDPWYNPEFTLVVEKESRIQAHVQIFDRTLMYDNQPLRIGGIGSVGTLPSARGSGYATALMKQAMEKMQQEGMQGAILFTGIHSFYERLGWKTIRQRESVLSVESLQHNPPEYETRIMVPEDYPVLHAMYSALQTQVSGTVQRNLDYWYMRPTWLLHLPVVVLHNKQIVGYFFASQYKKDKPVLTITEMGVKDQSDNTLHRLLAAMAEKAVELKCHTLNGFFRQHPIVRNFLDRHQWVDQEQDFLYMMWLDLNGSRFDSIQNKADQCDFLYWQTDGI